MSSHAAARLVAGVIAAVVVIAGLLVTNDWSVVEPVSTTTVTTDPVKEVEGTQKTTTVTRTARGRTTTTRTVEDLPGTRAQPGKRETTTVKGEQSAVERIAGDGGLAMLRLGAIVLVAFLAAALVQRAILGEYALKVGSLELPAIAAGSAAEGLAAASQEIAELRRALEQLQQQVPKDAAAVRQDLAVLYARLGDLNERVGG